MATRYSPSTRSAEDRLAAYSLAAAGALLAVAPTADAQVVYTDVDPDAALTIAGTAQFTIDFDGDSRDDALFLLDNPGGGFFRARVVTDEPNGGGVVGIGPVVTNYDYFYASVLDNGDEISASTTISNPNLAPNGADRDDFLLQSTFGGATYGNWGGVTDKYVGIRFQTTAGATHYAWARLDVTNSQAITVKDYAYNATAGAAISAGEGGGGTATEPDALADGYAFTPVAPNPVMGTSRFELTVGQSESVRVEIFDALGRSVEVLHDGALAAGVSRPFEVRGGSLPAGVYVVRVQGESFATSRSMTVVR